jgi:outer membrane lipoprotein LolB
VRRVAGAVLLVAASLLVACSTLPSTAPTGAEDEPAWQAHQSQLTTLSGWTFDGRVGFIDGKDSGSGSLTWSQQGERSVLDFHGPLGAGAVHMEGDAASLHVKTSRGDDFTTTDPETDLGARLHQPLPVLSLRYWVLGMPDPGADYTKTSDAHGELVSLDQRGWHVEYQGYAAVEGFSLPTLLVLQRDAVRIKLAVSDWTLPRSKP